MLPTTWVRMLPWGGCITYRGLPTTMITVATAIKIAGMPKANE